MEKCTSALEGEPVLDNDDWSAGGVADVLMAGANNVDEKEARQGVAKPKDTAVVEVRKKLWSEEERDASVT